MKALELLNAGQLQDAIDSALAEVKSHPADAGKRMVLAELLCFTDQFDRADKQLETAFTQDPELNIPTAVGRQLIRAATARQKVFMEGAVPDFLAPLDSVLEAQLKALTLHRGGQHAEMAQLIGEQIEPYCQSLEGVRDEHPFTGFRDLDDTTAACLEVLTTAGKYYWIAWHRIASLEFHPIERARDLLWREATISVRQGPDAVVYIPVRYPWTDLEAGEDAMLGRSTDWRPQSDEIALGVGQRLFVAGDDEELAILDLQSLAFEGPDEPVAAEVDQQVEPEPPNSSS